MGPCTLMGRMQRGLTKSLPCFRDHDGGWNLRGLDRFFLLVTRSTASDCGL
jgi:hypothetical protein